MIALRTTLLACLFTTAVIAKETNEPAGFFSYTIPDSWSRIPSRRKAIKPTTQFDTIMSRNPKRIMVPAGWEQISNAEAIAATEALVSQMFKFRLSKIDESTLHSDRENPVIRIRYSTNNTDTPELLMYSFRNLNGVEVCYICLVPREESADAMSDYDSVWKTLKHEE